MGTRERHNVKVLGSGERTIMFAHGYGCDQNMWRFLVPAFEQGYRVVLYDLMGCGKSDLRQYDRTKYDTLRGHAQDVRDILSEHAQGPAVFVGHSVSAMIGLLAGVDQPELFSSHVMIGPSPCYVDDGDYVGGFSRADIDGMLDTLDRNYLGWASAMAPSIMGVPDKPELRQELANSFCATDPEIAKHFARVTFLSDNRADVSKLDAPTLILQCTDDIIAPRAVGDYLHAKLPKAQLRLIENVGHCPHLSAPDAIVAAIHAFLKLIPVDESALYETAPCGLLSTNFAGMILRANRTFCTWLGYEAAELVDRKRLSDLLTMGGKIFHQTHWQPLLQMQGSVAEVQLDLVHKSGRTMPVLVNAVRHHDRHDLAVFVADDRRKYEDELLHARRRAEQLLESERLAQRQLADAQAQRALLGEQLVGIVSHDLRTPLSVVSLGSTMLAASSVTPEQANIVRRIESSNRRALRLVADLLDFTQARLGKGLVVQASEIDLEAVVAEAVDEVKLAWPGRMLDTQRIGTGLVWADPDRVAQLVTNLAGNALTYGDPARVVTVSTEVTGDGGVLAVHNHGAPIPEHLIAHIFEPLKRGEQLVKLGSRSVGLGLYIVSEIAAAHGGKVSVTSSAEAGTRFAVTLPRAAG